MKVKEGFVYIAKVCIKQLLKLTRIIPVKQNRIFFLAFSGKQYACSPKYIYEKLLSKYPETFDMVWMISHSTEIPGHPIYVKRNTLKYCYYMLTSHVIVSNGGFNAFLPYKKSQLKINTWHGGGAYKKGGLDTAVSTLERKRIQTDGKNTDILISSNKCFSNVFPPSSAINPQKVWEIGLPRNDMIISASDMDKSRIFQKLKINSNKKLLLYAPTYRGDFLHASFKDFTFDYESCKTALSKRFGGEWVLGFRMHYAYDEAIKDIPEIMNLSAYSDMQELLLAADVLITDYSSSIWDFSLTEKPCFIWATDLEQYKDEVDFYTPIEKWPFPIAKNNKQLLFNILNFNEDSYRKAIKQHHEDLGDCETGRASELVSDAIFDYCFMGIKKEEIVSRK